MRKRPRFLWIDVDSAAKAPRSQVAYSANPAASASAFSERFRPRAHVLDHLGRRQRPEPGTIALVGAARQPDQESGREQVAGAGRIDHLVDRLRPHRVVLLARDDQAALLAAGDDGELGVVAHRIDRGVEIRGLVEAVQLALVGEHDVDGAVADQIEKLRAVAIDAERVRQRQRDAAAGVVRDLSPP